jgi:MoxR-like ATPase
MTYTPKHFALPPDNALPRTGDIEPYVFNDNIAIAVDIALATGRPLLVAGAPGSGKSRLAEAMATLLEWNYLHTTMTSRTRLEDLTADYDHLLRMHDAQTRSKKEGMKPDWAYLKPGIFWWAFNCETAAVRGGTPEEAKQQSAIHEYPGLRTQVQANLNKTVLLIDEIDKAEPDLPNDLLEPLDRYRFARPDGKQVDAVSGLEILTIITTNRERELPAAFMRRCVSLVLEAPDAEKLVNIAQHHFPKRKDAEAFSKLTRAVANKTISLQEQAHSLNRRSPSTSEFLDALKTCDTLNIGVEHAAWQLIEQSILIKDLSDKNDSTSAE